MTSTFKASFSTASPNFIIIQIQFKNTNKMKQLSLFFPLIIFLGMLIIGCTNNPATKVTGKDHSSSFDLNNAKNIIKEKNNQFTKAHITGDTAFLNNIFTKDAIILPPNSDAITDRQTIEKVNLQYVNFGITEFTEETTAFFGNEEYLIDEGTYLLKYGKENTIEKGKYLNVWKMEDGDWKIYTNMWNTSTPL